MSIVGGLDVHRKQLTFDYLEVETGRLERGRIAPADQEHLASWLSRFDGRAKTRGMTVRLVCGPRGRAVASGELSEAGERCMRCCDCGGGLVLRLYLIE